MRLVDADALIDEAWKEKVGLRKLEHMIITAPTVALKSGYWIREKHINDISKYGYDAPYTSALCSQCKNRSVMVGKLYDVKYHFCPWCGAKMDEVEDEQ